MVNPSAPRPTSLKSSREGDFDIAIVGGGPAGSTLARVLAAEFSVLLIDKRPLLGPPEARGKCCGGLLAPDAQRSMAGMGLGLPKSVLVDPQLFSVRAFDLATNRERLYQRHYLNLDRELFDRWLVSLSRPDATVFDRSVFKGFETEGGKFKLNYLKEGEAKSATCRFLVGADGASSSVRRQICPASPRPTHLAVQAYYKIDKAAPHFYAFFDKSLTDFYGWAIPKGDDILVGLALPIGKNANERFGEFIHKLKAMGIIRGGESRREGAMIRRPLHTEDFCLGSGNAFLIGEAAGWISPSSAEGISYAMRSALNLATAFKANSPESIGRKYFLSTLALRFNLMGKKIKSPGMYNPFLRNLALRTGIGAVSSRQDG